MAIRITRVYTRKGDKGTTALVGGKRVAKDSLRTSAYGDIDELNSVIGLAHVFNAEAPAGAARDRLGEILRRIQNELFDLGSELATPADATYAGMFRVGPEQVAALETLIDECQKDLKPLASFVLPGGGRVGGFLHLARTVCRRAERTILRLGREEQIGDQVLPYVNRLSDLLFVLSRWIAKHSGQAEHLWERGLRSARRASPAGAGKKR